MGKKTCVLKDDFDVELVDGVKKDGDGVVYLNSRINGWDAIKAFYAANPHLLTLTELRRKGPSCSGPGLAPAGGPTPAGVGTTTTTSASAIPPTERELEAERDHRRELRARAKRRRASIEVRWRLADDLHTAYQWVAEGRVPRADATWVRGDPDFYKSFDFFYCHRSDTESDAEAASKLLETGPREYDRLPDGRPYDGRPWW